MLGVCAVYVSMPCMRYRGSGSVRTELLQSKLPSRSHRETLTVQLTNNRRKIN
jgi:hypothetical protein